jgi:ribosomal protein S18 acetylase RimI-like enzyme
MVMAHPNPDSARPATQPLIRRAGLADAAALSAIGEATFRETFGHLYPRSDLEPFLAQAYALDRSRADLAHPAKASWIVEADGAVVGFALAGPCDLPHPEVTPRSGELKRIYLLKAWQNGGLGRRLFAETLAWLQAGGPRDVWIGVWSENHGAQRFYARQGFEKVGEYGFVVGNTVDLEYILSRDAVSFSGETGDIALNEHNLA